MLSVMGIKTGKTPKHWNYFLSIEEDVAEVSRWVEFDKANFSCFSIQLARLLMVASAECDVIAKRLSADINEGAKAQSINRYREIIVERYPKFPESKVEIPQFGLELTPWLNWRETKCPPLWWSANNKVKHHRNDEFNKATLENTLNSVAGLFVLLTAYYGRRERSVTPAPTLFEPSEFAYIDENWIVFRGGG